MSIRRLATDVGVQETPWLTPQSPPEPAKVDHPPLEVDPPRPAGAIPTATMVSAARAGAFGVHPSQLATVETDKMFDERVLDFLARHPSRDLLDAAFIDRPIGETLLAHPNAATFYMTASPFDELISDSRRGRAASSMFGPQTTAPDATHADGRPRQTDVGRRIDLDGIRNAGIDPAHVLVFRVTQPSRTPKPELYWTTDYGEVVRGLRQEITSAQRQTSVVLVSTLHAIAGEGLIEDMNDCNGISLRVLGSGVIDQRSVIVSAAHADIIAARTLRRSR